MCAIGFAVVCAVVCAVVVVPVAGGPSRVSAATRYLDPEFAVDVQRDVAYGTAVNVDGTPITLTLDLYTPRGDTAVDRPVFVFAHGGFFVVGDKSGAPAWATRMAQRGYVAASINYRLGPEAVLAPVDTPLERQVIDNARADMQTSVRWFRANAAALRIDRNRIAVGGTSAGAVTALGVGINSEDPIPGDHADESSAVCTVVSISGANDPTAIGPNDAGAIFHHGALDTVVPFPQAVQTRDAMSAAGLPVSWNELPDEGHSLTSESLAAMVAPTVQWLYDRVATASFPCSPAVGIGPAIQPGRQTAISGLAQRSGVVSLVAVDNVAAGYVQSLPCGSSSGGSSNLNSDAPRQIRSALAVVRFGDTGASCLFNQARTHLVADLQGYFGSAAFDDVTDERLLDTRTGSKPLDESLTVISGRPNSTGVVSVVVTGTTNPGYVQVLACDAAPGSASNLNADRAGQTRAGLAFVRFDVSGRACVYAQRSTDLVVDLQGYMAPGAFDDITDARVLDSRTAPDLLVAGAMVPAPTLPAGNVTTIIGRPDTTAVVSIVATETSAGGYVQALPCGTAPGAYSNLNSDAPGQTVAGVAFVRFDAQGRACLFNQVSTHLVADVQGYLAEGAFVDVADVRVLDTRLPR